MASKIDRVNKFLCRGTANVPLFHPAESESEHEEPARPGKPTHIQKLLRAEAKRKRCEADEDVVSGSRMCPLAFAGRTLQDKPVMGSALMGML